jgi:hypothetical protein
MQNGSDPRFLQGIATLKHFDANSLEGNWRVHHSIPPDPLLDWCGWVDRQVFAMLVSVSWYRARILPGTEDAVRLLQYPAPSKAQSQVAC